MDVSCEAAHPARKDQAVMTQLLQLADKAFRHVRTGDSSRSATCTARDCLACALALFIYKYESMLKFDEGCGSDEPLRSNLEALFGVANTPSDTTLHRRLGRSRWHIEKHVFKTLKSQGGYHFEHNYRHGDRHLSTLIAGGVSVRPARDAGLHAVSGGARAGAGEPRQVAH